MLKSAAQLAKTLEPSEGASPRKFAAVKLLQPENAQDSMVVTLAGMVMLLRLLQPENASDPIVVTLAGMENTPLIPGGQTISMVFSLLYSTPSWLLYTELFRSTSIPTIHFLLFVQNVVPPTPYLQEEPHTVELADIR